MRAFEARKPRIMSSIDSREMVWSCPNCHEVDIQRLKENALKKAVFSDSHHFTP